MRFILYFLLLLICLPAAYAQQEVHHRTKIYLDGRSPAELENLGLEADHGIIKPGIFIINDYSESEITTLQENQFRYEILVRDVASYYIRRNTEIDRLVKSMQACNEPLWEVYDVPENFSLGSISGYHSYQEILDAVDLMSDLYPDLISIREPISSLQSHEGHNIYWTRISNNAAIDQQKPKALYTALHHAREPASVSQMLFFMWYMLENYGIDEEVTYLMDHTELYFIPCVNPDGYLYNESTMPNGGGMWRKNRRLNDNGTYGVDLNRNYGYMWGFNNTGSSPNPASQTYRGTAPFSEPEVENVRLFADARDFKIALNYHTYGNLLVHPWGYTSLPAQDEVIFKALGSLLTEHNHYHYGTDVETVGYSTNGSSDDWMYGDVTNKPSIIAYTPEVGNEFWPPSSFITKLCKENVWQNLAAAHALLKYGKAEYHFNPIMAEPQIDIDAEFTRYGFIDGAIQLKFTPLSSEITSSTSVFEFDLDQGEHEHAFYTLSIDEETSPGTHIMLLAEVLLDSFTIRDTLHLHFSHFGNVIVDDQAQNLSNWTTDSWGLAFNHFVSPPSSFNDSPGSFYAANTVNTMQWNDWIDLEEANIAALNFWARWSIETNYDYAQLHIRRLGEAWEPLCGIYSKPGSDFQAVNEPVWDGFQTEWVQEFIDLTPYTGSKVQLKWTLTSDSHIQFEGFYFDNVRIMIDDPTLNTTVENFRQDVWSLSPNPTDGAIKLETTGSASTEYEYKIYNMAGHLLMQQTFSTSTLEISTNNLPGGTYIIVVLVSGEPRFTQRYVVAK